MAEDVFRRWIPRMSVEWDGYCWIGDKERVWRRCRILDITPNGLGIEIDQGADSLVEDADIKLCIALEGSVRHVAPEADGPVRAGVALDNAVGDEPTVLNELNSLGIRW